MHRFVFSALIVLWSAANLCSAQAAVGLVEGQRVRLGVRCIVSHDKVSDCRHSRIPAVIDGVLTSQPGDSVRVRSDHAELVIPKSAVAQAWVVDGKRGQFGEGAGIGLVGGAVLGAAVGSKQEICFLLSCSPATAEGAVGGAFLGLLLGGLIGSQIHTDNWREIDHIKLSVSPRQRGVGVGMSFAF